LIWGILAFFTVTGYCQIHPVLPDTGKLKYNPEYLRGFDSNLKFNKLNTLSFENSHKNLMESPFIGKVVPFRDNYLTDENLVSTNDFSSNIKNNVNLSEFYRLHTYQDSPELASIRKYLGVSKNVFAFILLIMHILAYY
jgi:hypothetical protein